MAENIPIKNISSGVLYTAIAKYFGIIVSIVIGAILARILTPEEFGIVTIIIVLIYFFNILSDFGIGPAIIQNKELSQKDIESIFSFSIYLGMFLTILFCFSAEFIASFYKNEKLVLITRLLSLSVFFFSIRIIPYSLNLKKQRFKQIGITTVVVQIISGVVAIYLAYNDYSYFALVFKSIFDSFCTFIIFFILAPVKFQFRIDISSIRKILKFSFYQFLFNFFNYFSRNLDNLLIGKFMGPASLGYYDKSYQLMLLPVHNLTHVITPVLHPVLSEYQNDKKRVYTAYLKVVKLLALIGFPLSMFLYFSAHDIIYVFYGSQWENSIAVFQVLGLSVGIQMVLSSSGSIFQSMNRTDLLFLSGVLSSVLIVSAIFYGIFIGESLTDIAYGLIMAFIINFFQVFYLLIKRILNCSLIKFFKVFYFPVLIAFVIGSVLLLISYLSIENSILNLTINTMVSLLLFFGIILFKKEYRILFKTQYLKFKNIKRNK